MRVRRSKYPLLLLLLSLSPSGCYTRNNGQLTEPWIACGTTILLTWHASDAGWTQSTEASFSFSSVCCRLLQPETMEVCISAVANLWCIGPASGQSQRNPSLIGNPRFGDCAHDVYALAQKKWKNPVSDKWRRRAYVIETSFWVPRACYTEYRNFIVYE